MDVDTLAPPLAQSAEFGRACAALGVPTRHYRRRRAGSVVGCCLAQFRRLPLLGRVRLISRGPVCAAPSEATGWLAELLDRGPATLINGDTLPPDTLHRARAFPLMTPASIARVPVADPSIMRAALHQKWRNRLVRAEAAGLVVRQMPLPADPDHWLLRAETAQQRQRRYRNLPPALLATYAREAPGQAQVFEAWKGPDRLAGILVLTHGRGATYQTGVTTPEGRRNHAHNLLIWSALCWLASRDTRWLELGTLDQQAAPGLARFKMGAGAQVRQLSGTWLYHPALAPLAGRLPRSLAA